MLKGRLGAAVVIRGRRAGAIWGLGKRGVSSQGGATSQGTTPLPTGRSGDTAVHSSELLGDDAEAAAVSAAASDRTPTNETEQPLVPPKTPTSSPKLEHTEVGRSSRPNTYQKRQFSNSPAQTQPIIPEDINCVGPEVSPWPNDDAEDNKAQKRAQEADNVEYFKHHKASPLSEIEFADTRKPVTQATSHEGVPGPTLSYYGGGEMEGSLWLPEQMESAEETMLKAMKVWNWNKMRGDPESPHGRVLRALRGENW